MKYRKILWIFLIVLSLTGCKAMEPFFSKPTASFDKMTIQEMSLFDATLLFTFTVNNPNPLGVTVQKGTYDLNIEGASAASGTIDKQIRLEPGGSGLVELPVHVSFMDFFSSVMALARQDEAAYTLSGSFDVMGFDIPYETSGTFALPDFPQISVEALNIRNLSFSGAAIDIVLAVTNPNAFALAIDQLDYALDVGGMPILAGVTEPMREMEKNERMNISVPMEINFISMGRSAMNLLNKNTAPYEISGEMHFNIPDQKTRRLSFSRTGELSLDRVSQNP